MENTNKIKSITPPETHEESLSQSFRGTTYLLAQATLSIRNTLIDPALKEFSLTSLQYTILSVINRRSGLSSAELARQFFVTPQTIGPILSQLEKRDLISRKENPENRRLLAVSLTPAGEELLKKCDRRIQQIENTIFGDFDEQSVAELRTMLRAIYRKSRDLAESTSPFV